MTITDQPRTDDGRFGYKVQSSPEIGLSHDLAADGRTDIMVDLRNGPVTLPVADSGLTHPATPTREDELTIALDGDDVKVVYSIREAELEEDLAALQIGGVDGDNIREQVRRVVLGVTRGQGDFAYTSEGAVFRYTARIAPPEDLRLNTTRVMRRLEADPAYVFLRDGYHLPLVYALLEDIE